jgi:hypothetical protein
MVPDLAAGQQFPRCARRKRPRGGGAEQRDELAPFQLIELHSIPTSQGRIAGYRIGSDQSADIGATVQSVTCWRGRPMSEAGSYSAVRRCLLNVCFGSVFGLRSDISRRPRVPKAALSNRSTAAPYSITSSAMASSVGGTSRPSALAVLRLMTSSNLVGCTTGRSVGFAPLRIRPT